MKVEYARTKPGNKFVLTEAGLDVGRVRAKFEISNTYYKQYKYCVPKRWVDDGLVVEVPDGEK